ncbi:hypothetical protein V7114_06610 [Neobacillus niacini]|uniref:hypothetical protein n=1 Tax=Neobacillus niacini TaxID=86668 RepID=UPI003000398F
MIMDILIKLREIPGMKKVVYRILKARSLEIPVSVKIGKNVSFPHNAIGTVISGFTVLEDNVSIYQNVTLGRADVYVNSSQSKAKGILIKEGAVICAGAKVLCKEGTLVVGKNTVIAANAVLLNSTGENEIWGGIPARKIGVRQDLINTY